MATPLLQKLLTGDASTKIYIRVRWDWSRRFQLKLRSIYILVFVMNRNDYNRIFQCKMAKEVWRAFKATHEGTKQVRDSKIRILVNEFETFTIKHNENIVKTFTRFTDIFNGLEGLGRRFREAKKVDKILTCLSPKWNSKLEANEEAKTWRNCLFKSYRVLDDLQDENSCARKCNVRGEKQEEKHCT